MQKLLYACPKNVQVASPAMDAQIAPAKKQLSKQICLLKDFDVIAFDDTSIVQWKT
jgi:hypothetical protein